ncbi:MAG TPA: adenosylcobinamide-GDP ribazoletransferase, partial [Candidatus Borkfalkia excrementipullorum]|nr:adenosylcobinamide-GDP ribazoletransferase [Candidatus Borkfalkia excrementipullorum]
MKGVFNGLLIALSMYSKIPVPQAEWNERNMRYALCFFPLVGAIIGGIG